MPKKDFLTVDKEQGPFQIKIKGSRFISYIIPAVSKETAEDSIQRFRKNYHNATHVCYAYRLGEGSEESFRYNDDGEPTGTAGLPIFKEIKRGNLFNILLIVVRYFGGVKLGTGGLGRAYAQSAREAIESARLVRSEILTEAKLFVPFEFQALLMGIINKLDIKIMEQTFQPDGILFNLAIPDHQVAAAQKIIQEKSKGSLKLKIKG